MSAILLHPAVLAAVAWLAVTILFQFRPFSVRLLGLDPLGIVPRWRFFIPQSGRIDVAIEVRSGADEAELGAWTPLRMFPPRHALTWLWFPESHRATILWVSAQRLAARAARGAVAGAPDTVAYRTLERHIRQIGKHDGAAFQFALVDLRAGPGGRMLFTSQVHHR